ncbi:MAG: site-2 protease family protein [Chloroflexota bacterium]|nr:site-2 protease family protein [Chloroflexota bacterium]
MGIFGLPVQLWPVWILVVLMSMTIHEWAHNYVGWRMGDPVPRQDGKLTLNPLAHIYWFGFIMFVVVGFGVLGTANISPYRMKKEGRRWRWLAAIAAGPVSNLILAVIAALIFRLAPDDVLRVGSIGTFLTLLITFNVLLFVFNLLPLYPIDGWQIVLSLLPAELAGWWQRNQMNTYYILIGLILFGFVAANTSLPNPLAIIIGQPAGAIARFLYGF